VFSWIEWPTKGRAPGDVRQHGELTKTDERFSPEKNPMPFDGKRMIYGGFQPIVEEGEPARRRYVQGFIVAGARSQQGGLSPGRARLCEFMKDYGAARVVEAWQDDVPAGKQTDFLPLGQGRGRRRSSFSFIEWPSREICDGSHEKMMRDQRMKDLREELRGPTAAVRRQAHGLWRLPPGGRAGPSAGRSVTMANPVGAFIWYELMTTDPDAARDFYGKVVGWKIVGEPPADGGLDYRHIIREDGGSNGGVLFLGENMCNGGARPCWLGYLFVADVDAATAAIEADGGKVLMPKTTIEVGRFAIGHRPAGRADLRHEARSRPR
jgi:uncharacterized protein YbaA (DUF1428 family)/predicted enzyme related to lactoylglutathione lyase